MNKRILNDFTLDKAVHQLIGVIATDDNENSRRAAIQALAGFPGPVPFVFLRDLLLNGDDEELRAAAAASLAGAGKKAALRVLKKIAEDPSEMSDLVRGSSLKAIEQLLELSDYGKNQLNEEG